MYLPIVYFLIEYYSKVKLTKGAKFRRFCELELVSSQGVCKMLKQFTIVLLTNLMRMKDLSPKIR